MNEVAQFVNSVGFPIATCVYLMWAGHKNTENNHKILCEFKDVIKENTTILKDIQGKVK